MRLGLPYLRRMVTTTVVGFLIVASVSSVAVTRAGPPVPKQFYRPLGNSLTLGERPVVTVAHNAGNDPVIAREAIRSGAGVVEIDVLLYADRLHAAHHLPKTAVHRLVWNLSPPVTLESAWEAASAAAYVQLDLKSTAPQMIALVLDFLAERQHDENWIVSSPDIEVLNRIAGAFPHIDTVLSIGTTRGKEIALGSPETLSALRGVSVRASLLDEDAVATFHAQGLFVLAWTVDDPRGLDRALRFGVDGIVTNNLAIVERLRRQDGEPVALGIRVHPVDI